MNIFLLYGPGEVAKRSQLIKIKHQFDPASISVLDLQQVKPVELDNLLLSTPLFFDQRLIVVENTQASFDLEDFDRLSSNTSSTIVFVSSALPTNSKLLITGRKLGCKIICFEEEKKLLAFPYLDSLIEQRQEVFLELEKLRVEYGGMYIISMIYYLLRRNALPLPAGSFIKQKIRRQKEKFSTSSLQAFYKQTLETEYKIKSGVLDERLGLTKLTDFFYRFNREGY